MKADFLTEKFCAQIWSRFLSPVWPLGVYESIDNYQFIYLLYRQGFVGGPMVFVGFADFFLLGWPPGMSRLVINLL